MQVLPLLTTATPISSELLHITWKDPHVWDGSRTLHPQSRFGQCIPKDSSCQMPSSRAHEPCSLCSARVQSTAPGQNGVPVPERAAIKGRLLRSSFSFLLLLNLCKMESQIITLQGSRRHMRGGLETCQDFLRTRTRGKAIL